MLAVTQSARKKLQDTIPQLTDEPGYALRLVVSPEEDHQLELVLGTEQKEDQVVTSPTGRKVLFVEPNLAEQLDGIVFDYVESEKGKGFTMRKTAARNGN